MYLVKTPQFIRHLFPNFTWKIPANGKTLYLTFDDGPIPEVTPWVLDVLDDFNAKASFFCVGENILKYSDLFRLVQSKGHSVGNHTFNHLNGWASDNIAYFHNVRHCAKLTETVLFRPPYGKLKPKQAQFLQRHYRIVMWDVLSGDFDQKLSGEDCYNNVINNAESGSIIVFHDSLKAEDKVKYALPRVLEYFSEQGFRFDKLNEKQLMNLADSVKRIA